MKPDAERISQDRLLKRAAATRRRAARLTPESGRSEWLLMKSELTDSLATLTAEREKVRARIVQTSKGRVVTAAYGRAAALRFPHR